MKPEELPTILTEEHIIILAKMVDHVPQQKDWHQIMDQLSSKDYNRVEEKRIALQKEEELERLSLMTDQEKKEVARQRKNRLENLKNHRFQGNMGEPETAQDYKNRYGVWPPNYKGDRS